MVSMMMKFLKIRPLRVVLLLALFQNTAFAYDASAEVRFVVDSYLASLSAGDVTGIRAAIGGKQLRHTERRLANGEQYGAFLRNHYLGVQMAIDTIEALSDRYKVRVLFYTASEPTAITFIVAQEKGAWLIIDEER
jgi:hypothetical protein